MTQGNRTKEDEFIFNKDAGMYQCKAGHLAVHKYLDKRKNAKKNRNSRMIYYKMPKKLLKFQNLIFRFMPQSGFEQMGFGKKDFLKLCSVATS